MAKQIRIDEVVHDRKLEPDDDITELAIALRDQGQRIPIILDHENRLIKGLRRIEALRSLGHSTVLATSTSMYPVVCALVQQAREHGVAARPPGPRRIWDLYRAAFPLLRITRSAFMTGRKGRGARQPEPAGGRAMLSKALGFGSGSALQSINQVYKALDDADPEKAQRAKVVVPLMEQGEVSCYQAVEMITKPAGLQGPIRNLAEQRATLQSGVATFRGLLKGLEQLGPISKKMPMEELQGYVGELMSLRAQLYRFTKLLQEETNRA